MKYKIGDKVIDILSTPERKCKILSNIDEFGRYKVNYGNDEFDLVREKYLFPQPQTNRQWVESLSDEELAKFNKDSFCKICPYNTRICKKDGTKYCDFVKVYTEWLQAEHKDEI